MIRLDDKIIVLTLVQDYDDPTYRKCRDTNEKYGNDADEIDIGYTENFAASRNQLQAQALADYPEAEWFLWIDSDEVFPWEVELRPQAIHFKNKLHHWTVPIRYDIIFFPRYNLFPDVKHYRLDSGCYPDYQGRLFKSDLEWVDPVHETVLKRPSVRYTKLNEVHIYHYGWLKPREFQILKHRRFHDIDGRSFNWQFPTMEEVSVKKLPKEEIIKLG